MKLWPSRQDAKKKQEQPSVMVADLDALLTEKISFKLFGKVHTIDPLTVEQFAKFSQAYFEVTQMGGKAKVSPEEMIAAYSKLTSVVVPSVGRDEISKMTQQQAAGLFQIMADLHTGRLFGDEKKTLQKVKDLLNSSPDQ